MEQEVEDQLRFNILDALHAVIVDAQPWDDVVNALMEAIETNTHYVCRVTHLQHTRGDYYWSEREIGSWTITATTREALLEKMAEAKIKHETERVRGEYQDVRFGNIIHAVGAEDDVWHQDDPDYDSEITETEAWAAHLKKLEAAKEAAVIAAGRAAKAAEVSKEAAERQQLAILKARYEGKA